MISTAPVADLRQTLSKICASAFLILALCLLLTQAVNAQSFRLSNVEIEGNERIEDATVLSFLNLPRGASVSGAQLNDALQRLRNSGLFETVELVPAGGTLLVQVTEYPTINRVNIEGNDRLDDENLLPIIQTKSRRVYNPSTVEADTTAITEAYRQAGRIAATVTPRVINRSNNRVDVVFEVTEGRVSELERISFVGNRAYSDRRLRRVVGSKQAGIFRAIVRDDTFINDRIAFDRQLLRDFYLSRGYVDFQVLSASPELTRSRDAFFITFNVREGQQFSFGEITAFSDLSEIDSDEFLGVNKIRTGETYSPAKVENTITRMERLALEKGLQFIRVEPRVVRNDADLTLDVEFAIIRGPRVFVERIDVEGNETTLDRVIRRQFKTVEGDPFNPRAIRDAAERIRALNYFSRADVNAREGSSGDQVIVDVDVDETTTGSLGFGLSYGTEDGVGYSISFSERNFLGRGQTFSFSLNTASETASSSIRFVEPAFLGRDLELGISVFYETTSEQFSLFDTQEIGFEPRLEFPVSENGRVGVGFRISQDTIENIDATTSPIIQRDAGELLTTSINFGYSYDTRRTGLNPNAGVLFRINQEFGFGDNQFSRTTGLVAAESRIFREEIALRGEFEMGALSRSNGNSRISDRFFLGSRTMRGFEGGGLGPRDLGTDDALGGNLFAVARVETEFPLGLPEEYGISGGFFLDVGSLWSLDDTAGSAGVVDDSFALRSVLGFSLFWDTQIGPLRFNFSRALQKEDFDKERTFDFSVSTRF